MSPFDRDPRGRRPRSGALFALLLGASALAGCGPTAAPTASTSTSTVAEPAPTATPEQASPADETSPADGITPSTPAPAPSPSPVIRRWTVTTTTAVPFATRTVRDPALAVGARRTRTRGAAGVRTLTYELTSTNGVQTGKRLLRTTVTRAPVTSVVAIGTKAASRCDPNYSGCVPIASDVDCAGGSGNGPAYVTGPVRVIGTDIYRLDADHDGIGCE